MDLKKTIIGVLFVLFIIIGTKWNRDSKKDSMLKTLEQGKCAIGYFKKAIKAGGAWPGYPDEVQFYFFVDAKKVVGINRNVYPPPEIEATIKKGDKFLVFYLKEQPGGYCKILFNYPIKDSLDYQNYKMSLDSIRTQAIQKWKESLEE